MEAVGSGGMFIRSVLFSDLNATQTYGTAWFTLIHNIFVNNLDGQKYVLLEILDLSTSVDFDTLSSSSSELWCIYVCTG